MFVFIWVISSCIVKCGWKPTGLHYPLELAFVWQRAACCNPSIPGELVLDPSTSQQVDPAWSLVLTNPRSSTQTSQGIYDTLEQNDSAMGSF